MSIVKDHEIHLKKFQIDIYITAAHISGYKNANADRESRELLYDLEWILWPKSLSKALKMLKFNQRQTCFQAI